MPAKPAPDAPFRRTRRRGRHRHRSAEAIAFAAWLRGLRSPVADLQYTPQGTRDGDT